MLAAAGGVLGLISSVWALDLLVRFAPAGIPRLDQVVVDGTVIAFTLAIAIAAGLVFGMAPALHARSGHFQDALRLAGRGSVTGSHQTTRQVLVVAEIALSLVLVIVAALLRVSSACRGLTQDSAPRQF